MTNTDERPGREREGHRRIDDIEVLRAVAVGLVLVDHVRINLITFVWGIREPFYRTFGFWSGVDLFLVISGFVIARNLLPMLASAQGPLEFFNTSLSFWVRRAWRLLPSAWLWLVVILLCAAGFNDSGSFQPWSANVEGAVAAVLNIANLRTVYAYNHYPTGAAFPYWSLSLEEQFYVVLPFLVYFARRRLALVLVVLVAAQLFITRIGAHSSILMNMVKSDALCLGILLSLWSGRPSYRRLELTALKTPLARMLLLPGFIFAFALLSGPNFGLETLKVGLVAQLAAAMVWLASYDRDYLLPPGQLKRFMCWMGARSYAIYLVHIPAFSATREVWYRLHREVFHPTAAHGVALVVTALPVVFIFAELNYRLIELPLRKHGARIAERIRERDLAALDGSAAPHYA